ncbi:D-arabinono-1,4-lactone oxidase-domain-containing protein [Mycena amicta]|nr:D-arabinono-1,4-lactone oxidase-domain-containing protein [Mycena amicta]
MSTSSADAISPATIDENPASITVVTETQFVNWGRSFECLPLAILEPTNEEQCVQAVKLVEKEGLTLRVVGVGHSPSDIACTGGFMLRMTQMNRVMEINNKENYVVAEASITLTKLYSELARHDLAMSNLGSISDVTLGGVVSTATHGSGITFGPLSGDVLELHILLADGSIVLCSADILADLFHATLCGLGTTGIILTIKLGVEKSFRLKEQQWSMSFDDLLVDFDRLVHSSEHVRFWWLPGPGTVKASVANRTAEEVTVENRIHSWFFNYLIGFQLIQLLLFFARFWPYATKLASRVLSWLWSGRNERVDDSLAIFSMDCRYREHTTEWAIPFESARACLRELQQLFLGHYPSSPVEIRFSAADKIWLSPSYERETCWIGIAQYRPYGFNVRYRLLFREFEAILFKHNGRPHWAKTHPLTPDKLERAYPKFHDFRRVIEDVDPDGTFCNEYVRRHLLGKEDDARTWKARKAEEKYQY